MNNLIEIIKIFPIFIRNICVGFKLVMDARISIWKLERVTKRIEALRGWSIELKEIRDSLEDIKKDVERIQVMGLMNPSSWDMLQKVGFDLSVCIMKIEREI